MMRSSLAAFATSVLLAGPAFAEAPTKDIVDTAVAAGNFETLVGLVKAAGLVETLKGEGPFTLFAPTDDAFSALPEGKVDVLRQDTDTLKELLTYHVVPGAVMSSELTDGMMVKTVQGQSLTIGTEGGVTVNDAAVVTADIKASNGVIHVIDAVITPEKKEMP